MNKKFTSVYSLIKLFSIISVFIFFSCGGENTVSSFSFQLGDKAAQNIHNAARNITGSDDGLYTVYLYVSQTFDRELEPEDEKNWQEMEEKLFHFDKEYTVSRQELSSKRFIVDNVPLNVNLMVDISVFYQGAFITSGYCENVVCKGAETQVHITLENPEYPDPELGDDNLNGSITITSGKAVFELTKTETGFDYYNLLGDSFTLTMTAEDGSALEDAEMEAELHYGGKDIGSEYYQFNKSNGYFTFSELNTKGTYYVYVKGSYTIEGTTFESTASFPIYVSYSNVITVPDSGLVEITSLQEACDLAQKLADASDGTEGFSIYVSGTLTGPQSIKITNDKVSWIEVIGQNSQSDDNPTDCIDANNEGTALTISADVSVSLRGIKICNGKGTEACSTGGIDISGLGNITIYECSISGNEGIGDGGGINIKTINGNERGKDVYISETTITNNTALCGGGIYCTDFDNKINLYLNNVTLNQNRAICSDDYYGQGGAIYICSNLFIYGQTIIGDPDITETTATSFGNSAEKDGGAIYSSGGDIYLGYSSSSTKESFTGGIYGNYAGEYGGAIYMTANGQNLIMDSGYIANNTAIGGTDTSGKYGNGIYEAIKTGSYSGDYIQTISMSGSIHFATEDDIKLGYVYYQNGYGTNTYGKITVTGPLTGGETVATITPGSYNGVTMLEVAADTEGITLAEAINLFKVNDSIENLTSTYGANNIYRIHYALTNDGTAAHTGISTKSKPDTVGDIVLSDGTAVFKDLVSYLSDEQKEMAVAYIFYAKGTQSNAESETKENYILGDRVLGFALTNSAENLTGTGASFLTGSPSWESEFANTSSVTSPAETICQRILKSIPQDSSGNEISETSNITGCSGETDGSKLWTLIASESAIDSSTTTAEDYLPAFKYALEYGDGWYLPTIAELAVLYNSDWDEYNNYVYPHLEGIENTMQVSETVYWSASTSEQDYAYTVNFADGSINANQLAGSSAYVLPIKDFTN